MALFVDIFLAIILLLALYLGAKKGFVVQAISIISIFIALWLSNRLTPGVSGWVNEYFGGEESFKLIKIVVYVVLFVIIVILCRLIAGVIKKIMNITILGGVDTILGAVFGLIKALLVIAVVVYLLNSILPKDFLKESYLYGLIANYCSNKFSTFLPTL